MAKIVNSGNNLAAGDEANEGASIRRKLTNSQSLQDIFELVKELVWKALKVDQAGLLLGLAEMGIGPQGILGAFYSPDANTIVINKTVMNRVKKLSDPLLYNSYCFYILLHEYLHSCGFYDENQNRQIVAAIAAGSFGPDHAVTKLATTQDAMLKLIQTSFQSGSQEAEMSQQPDSGIEFVERIDRRNTNYIN